MGQILYNITRLRVQEDDSPRESRCVPRDRRNDFWADTYFCHLVSLGKEGTTVMCRSRNESFHVNCRHHGEESTDPLHHLRTDGGLSQSRILVQWPSQAEPVPTRRKSCCWHLLSCMEETSVGSGRSWHNQHGGTSGNSCQPVSKKGKAFCPRVIDLSQEPPSPVAQRP